MTRQQQGSVENGEKPEGRWRWWRAASSVFLASVFLLGVELEAARVSVPLGVLAVFLLSAACAAVYAWWGARIAARADARVRQYATARDAQWRAFLSEYAPGLPVLNGQLRETAQQVEQAVVQVCDAFSNMAARAQESLAQSGRGAEGEERSNEAQSAFQELMGAAQETLTSILDRIVQNSMFSMRVVYRMEDIEQGMQEIVVALREIEQIASRTKLLALNTTIEAARFGGQSKGFAVVAAEITKLSERSTHASETIRQLVGKVGGDVHQAYEELKELASSNVNDAEASRQRAENALTHLGSSNDAMRSSVETAAHNIHMLTQDIAQAVMGLQFQDAVNQRVAHVVGALQEMHEAFIAASDGRLETIQNNLIGKQWAQRMQQHYSMAAERRVLAGPAGAATTIPGESNVELF